MFILESRTHNLTIDDVINLIQSEIEKALQAKKYKECDELNADLLVLQLTLESIPTAAAGTYKHCLQYSTALCAFHLTISNLLNDFIPTQSARLLQPSKASWLLS
jgi:hypothetical protein